ncbi:hypothetical protein HOLleu_35469 [Holothuria leucospilota]|uniref:Uncharacterized protein n=1 Tax=Holothuria leucospilota TaxID=206669 RepID=A0A9Q0YMU7_HOLLE|nr:hypothetical protein HOLleu_35469 [Holothuria leucospilota]
MVLSLGYFCMAGKYPLFVNSNFWLGEKGECVVLEESPIPRMRQYDFLVYFTCYNDYSASQSGSKISWTSLKTNQLAMTAWRFRKAYRGYLGLTQVQQSTICMHSSMKLLRKCPVTSTMEAV